MGRGKIVQHLGDAEYQITIDYNNERVDAEIMELDRLIAESQKVLADQITKRDDLQNNLNGKIADQNVAITTYRVNPTESNFNAIIDITRELSELGGKLSPILYEIQRLKLVILSSEKKRTFKQSLRPDETAIVSAWCIDLSDGANGRPVFGTGADVGTIEVADVTRTHSVMLKAGFLNGTPGGQKPTASDGIIQHSVSATSASSWYNRAIQPASQKWKPRYRVGTLIAKLGTLGRVLLDVPDPIDQDIIVNQAGVIDGIPFSYMTCDHQAFQIHDRVVIEFMGRDWKNPVIIGFEDHPRICPTAGGGGGGGGSAYWICYFLAKPQGGGNWSFQLWRARYDVSQGWVKISLGTDLSNDPVTSYQTWLGEPDSNGIRETISFAGTRLNYAAGFPSSPWGVFIDGARHAVNGTSLVIAAARQSNGDVIALTRSIGTYHYYYLYKLDPITYVSTALTINGQTSYTDTLVMPNEVSRYATFNRSGTKCVLSRHVPSNGIDSNAVDWPYLELTIAPGATDGVLQVVSQPLQKTLTNYQWSCDPPPIEPNLNTALSKRDYWQETGSVKFPLWRGFIDSDDLAFMDEAVNWTYDHDLYYKLYQYGGNFEKHSQGHLGHVINRSLVMPNGQRFTKREVSDDQYDAIIYISGGPDVEVNNSTHVFISEINYANLMDFDFATGWSKQLYAGGTITPPGTQELNTHIELGGMSIINHLTAGSYYPRIIQESNQPPALQSASCAPGAPQSYNPVSLRLSFANQCATPTGETIGSVSGFKWIIPNAPITDLAPGYVDGVDVFAPIGFLRFST